MYSCSAAEAFLCSAPARGFSNPGASQGSIIWILYNLQSKLASEVSVWGGCKKAKLGMQKRAQTSYLILSNIFVKAVLTAAVFQPKIGAGCGRLKSSAATIVYTGDSGSATLLPFYLCVFFIYQELIFRSLFSTLSLFFVLFKHRWKFYFASVFFPLSFFSAVDLCVFHFLIFLPYFLFLIFSPLFTLFAPLKVRRKKMKKSLQSINPVACHADAKFSATFSRSICTVYTHRKKSGKID